MGGKDAGAPSGTDDQPWIESWLHRRLREMSMRTPGGISIATDFNFPRTMTVNVVTR
jgi:hypothetical protein